MVSKKKAQNRVIKTQKRIVNCLKDGGLTRYIIVARTNIARSTVFGYLDRLEKEGIIKKSIAKISKKEKIIGRPPVIFSLVSQSCSDVAG